MTAVEIGRKIKQLRIQKGLTLEELPLSEYQAVSPAFDESVYRAIDLDNCVARRSQSEE